MKECARLRPAIEEYRQRLREGGSLSPKETVALLDEAESSTGSLASCRNYRADEELPCGGIPCPYNRRLISFDNIAPARTCLSV
jgi:hypothetical protein